MQFQLIPRYWNYITTFKREPLEGVSVKQPRDEIARTLPLTPSSYEYHFVSSLFKKKHLISQGSLRSLFGGGKQFNPEIIEVAKIFNPSIYQKF